MSTILSSAPCLETRRPLVPALSSWTRFLPLAGLPFTTDEMHLLLDGQIIARGKESNMVQFRIIEPQRGGKRDEEEETQ